MSAEQIIERINSAILGLWEGGTDFNRGCWALVMGFITFGEMKGEREIDGFSFCSDLGHEFHIIVDNDLAPGIIQIVDLGAAKFQKFPFGPEVTLREYYGILPQK